MAKKAFAHCLSCQQVYDASFGVEHAIGRMKKFRIFADIHRNNGLQNMIAKNVAALANVNLKTG